jgi:hypothetical protein
MTKVTMMTTYTAEGTGNGTQVGVRDAWISLRDAWFAGFWVAMLSFLGRKAGLVDVKVHPKALEPPRPLHLMERATGACAKGIC